MSKLAPSLKQLINVASARPGTTPAPAGIAGVYRRAAADAASRGYGRMPWLVLSAAASFTVNSPASLLHLFQVATELTNDKTQPNPVAVAETIREVGLKCISFNGIPRSINSLGAFREGLPAEVAAQLATAPTRGLNTETITATNDRGRGLWNSIYTPLETKLEQKLAESHPDLPVHILGSHYGPLLSDPAGRGDRDNGLASIGRCLTSVVAISCLRAQTSVGPQVLSHVFGLRKGVEQGLHKAEAGTAEEADAIAALATDKGSEWILRSVDSICEEIGRSFAKL